MCFDSKPTDRSRIIGQFRRQKLQCDDALQLRIFRFVYDSHAATTQELKQLITLLDCTSVFKHPETNRVFWDRTPCRPWLRTCLVVVFGTCHLNTRDSRPFGLGRVPKTIYYEYDKCAVPLGDIVIHRDRLGRLILSSRGWRMEFRGLLILTSERRSNVGNSGTGTCEEIGGSKLRGGV